MEAATLVKQVIEKLEDKRAGGEVLSTEEERALAVLRQAENDELLAKIFKLVALERLV